MIEKLDYLPEKPGVYLMKNSAAEIIYVGKASSLRDRVRSYFSPSRPYHPKIEAVVSSVEDIEYIVTDSDVEALILECNLIKRYRPRYNIRLKDDKRYPYLKITMSEDFPRIFTTRQTKPDGARYFGPYTSTQSVRKTLNLIRSIFPIRNCRLPINGKARRACLDYHLHHCSAPCIGATDKEEYQSACEEVCLFLEGKHREILEELERRMEKEAEESHFEQAARIRDRIKSIEIVISQQKMVSPRMENQDIIALAQDEEQACVQIFFVRGGKILGREHFFLEKTPDSTSSEILSAFLQQYYFSTTSIPREILLPVELEDRDILARWLTAKRKGKVEIIIPQRGRKWKLIEMVSQNAQLLLEEQQLKSARDGKLDKSVLELQKVLGLGRPPVRVEAFDISNIAGKEPVGSLVVFNNGRPWKEEYRVFKIRTKTTPDDYAMMQEVVHRRYQRVIAEKRELPDLILIDGGKGQLNSVLEVLRELKLDSLPVIGLAKGEEHLYIPGRSEPVIFTNSSALHLVQRIRDEAHRFALTFHRKLRREKTTRSVLDEIPGIGEKRRKILLDHFNSLEKLRQASVEQLQQVKGINPRLALAIYDFFHQFPSA